MFHPGKIEEKIDTRSIAMIKSSPTDPNFPGIFQPGFRLQRHSIPSVARANEVLEGNIQKFEKVMRSSTGHGQPRNTAGSGTNALCCQCDFVYWVHPVWIHHRLARGSSSVSPRTSLSRCRRSPCSPIWKPRTSRSLCRLSRLVS